MGDLKKLYKKAKKYKDDDSTLNFEIDVFLDAKNKKPKEDRPNGLHPSQLSKGISCERWLYYSLAGERGNVNVGVPQSQSLMAMEIGKSIHTAMHRIFYGMGILEGLWECSFCRHKFWGVSPSSCPECWAHLNKHTAIFKEIPLSDGLFVGHSDGILNRKNNRCFLEIKSIKNVSRNETGKITGMLYGFELLENPLDDHVIQSTLYMDMWKNMVDESNNQMHVITDDDGNIKLSTTPENPVLKAAKIIGDVPVTLVMYVAKNTGERKTFGVKYDEDRIRHIRTVSKKIRNAFFDQDIDRLDGVCYTLSVKDCAKKKCRYKDNCKANGLVC